MGGRTEDRWLEKKTYQQKDQQRKLQIEIAITMVTVKHGHQKYLGP